LCFLVVFGCHAFHTTDTAVLSDPLYRFLAVDIFGQGALGVNVFFALSGFLITYLLIQEARINQRIDVPRFWLRRVLRIWPLYFLVVLIGFSVIPWIKHQVGDHTVETSDPWHYVLFFSNLDKAQGLEPASSTLTVLWSIAVEEQFYLVWPLLLVIGGRRAIPAICITLLLASILFRALHPELAMRSWHTFSCMGDLATGAIGAYILSTEKGRALIERAGPATTIAWHALTIGAYLFIGPVQTHLGGMVTFPALFAVAATGTILLQCAGTFTPARLPTAGPLAAMGRISYGLYCLHMVALLAVLQVMQRLSLGHEVWHVVILQPVAALLLSVILAWASNRYLERPFLKLKDRFAYIRRN
jgi:peptidoglycan/LPS O-acetylase OafA/YrhL